MACAPPPPALPPRVPLLIAAPRAPGRRVHRCVFLFRYQSLRLLLVAVVFLNLISLVNPNMIPKIDKKKMLKVNRNRFQSHYDYDPEC
jgi:hypothetical protein